MLQKEDVQVWLPHTNLKGGEGIVYLSHESMNNSRGRIISYIWIPPHCSVGLHTHDENEEIYNVVEGGPMKVNGQYCRSSICKKGESHDCVNDTDEDMYVMSIMADHLGI